MRSKIFIVNKIFAFLVFTSLFKLLKSQFLSLRQNPGKCMGIHDSGQNVNKNSDFTEKYEITLKFSVLISDAQ